MKLHWPAIEAQAFEAQILGSDFRPKGVTIGGRCLEAGTPVRIRPRSDAGAMGIILANKVAMIESVEFDATGTLRLALVLRDPVNDLGMLRRVGHRFVLGADEVDPLPGT